MKTQIEKIYNQIINHEYWHNKTKNTWNDIRLLISQLDRYIATYEFWNCTRGSLPECGRLYDNMYAPIFTTYTHDLRSYISYNKLLDENEEIKKDKWIKQYLDITKCFIDDKKPYTTGDGYTISVEQYNIEPYSNCFYMVYTYKDKTKMLNFFKKYSKSKNSSLAKWASGFLERIENGTDLIYK